MPRNSRAGSRKIIQLPFFNVRHISCPEDLDEGRKVYVGHASASAVVDLPTDENVRDYLLEAEGRKRRRPTQVHKAILDTLANYPRNFSVLNSGVVIVARDCEIDETSKCLRLTEPSIINGSQTQGVIKDFCNGQFSADRTERDLDSHIKFEIIVTDNEALIAEISIARNLQNDVMSISIAGRLGQLDELEAAFQKKMPGTQLQKSETKFSEDYVKTERLLQVITALIPKSLWPENKEFSKVFSYSMKAKCLKMFREVYAGAKNPADMDDHRYRDLYQFYLDIAAEAYTLYQRWKSHQSFQGTGLHSIKRDEKGRIKEVPDGIVFPILASLSAFATKKKSGWTIDPPALFSDDEIIRTAKSVYQDIAYANPWNMGKSKACYSALYQITSIFARLST